MSSPRVEPQQPFPAKRRSIVFCLVPRCRPRRASRRRRWWKTHCWSSFSMDSSSRSDRGGTTILPMISAFSDLVPSSLFLRPLSCTQEAGVPGGFPRRSAGGTSQQREAGLDRGPSGLCYLESVGRRSSSSLSKGKAATDFV